MPPWRKQGEIAQHGSPKEELNSGTPLRPFRSSFDGLQGRSGQRKEKAASFSSEHRLRFMQRE